MEDVDKLLSEIEGTPTPDQGGDDLETLLSSIENDKTLPGNDPAKPLSSNELSFATKIKIALAGDQVSIEKMLIDDLGPENVTRNDAGEVLVRDGGAWVKADAGFAATLAASTPEIAASIAGRAAGAKAGAVVGTFFAPGAGTLVGGFAGGLLGGAIVPALAKVVKDKGAEAAGIKTEYDAEQAKETFLKEAALNLVIDGALGAAGVVWKGVGKPLVRVTKGTVQRAKDVITDPSVTAEAMEKLINGTKKADWSTVLRPESAATFVDDLNKVIEWEKTSAAGIAKSSIDPATRKMTRLATSALRGARAKASQTYESAWKAVESSGALNTSVSKAKVEAGFKTALNNLGILTKNDETGEFLIKKTPDTESIMQIFDPKSLSTLNKVLKQLTSQGDVLKAGELKQLLSGVDDILESSGYYRAGDAAISNQARRVLMGLRKNLNDEFVTALKKSSPKVADQYSAAAAKYAKFRSVYDDFAPIADNPERLTQTINKMLGDKGGNLETDFSSLLRNVGVDDRKIIKRMQELRAARNLSGVFAPGSTGVGAVTGGVTGLKSPREMATFLAEKAMVDTGKAVQRVSPVSPASKLAAETAASALDFVGKLSPEAKRRLLYTPELAKQFFDTAMAAGVPQVMAREAVKALGVP